MWIGWSFASEPESSAARVSPAIHVLLGTVMLFPGLSWYIREDIDTQAFPMMMNHLSTLLLLFFMKVS